MQAAVDIKFSCPCCGQRMSADTAAAGYTASCPGCDSEVTIPLLETATPPATSDGAVSPAVDGAALLIDWEATQRQLGHVQEVAERLEAANEHLQTELKHLEADRETLANELGSARQRLISVETQLGTSNSELSLSRGAIRQLEEALQHAIAERDRIGGTQVSLEWKLTELEASLRNAEAECARMSALSEELLQARSRISDLEWERNELQREREKIQRDLAETENGRELMVLREREKTLELEKQRMAKALDDALEDASRFEERNRKARFDLEEIHRRWAAAEKRADSLSSSEVGRDNEILRGILARQKEELEHRYRDLVRLRRAKLGLKLTYWVFGVGALAVAAFAFKVLSELF